MREYKHLLRREMKDCVKEEERKKRAKFVKRVKRKSKIERERDRERGREKGSK